MKDAFTDTVFMQKWQNFTDLLDLFLDASVLLIFRNPGSEIETGIISSSPGNPFKTGESGSYDDLRSDFDNLPGLRIPLKNPDGTEFGILFAVTRKGEPAGGLEEKAPLAFQSLNENGCFIDINPMWLKTLGYDREEVVGRGFHEFLHPDFQEPFKKNFPEFKKRGYVHDVQLCMRKNDGSISPV